MGRVVGKLFGELSNIQNDTQIESLPGAMAYSCFSPPLKNRQKGKQSGFDPLGKVDSDPSRKVCL